MPGVGAGVSNEKLCTVDHLQILPRAESDALDAFVDARKVDATTEYPYNLHIGVVVKKVLGKVSGVASILLVIVCPAYNSASLNLGGTPYNGREDIAKEFQKSV